MAGMVACGEPIAARVGRDVLSAGGNAVDAAIATAIAEGVTQPISCGIGGHGVMVLHRASTNEQVVLNFWGRVGTGRDLGFLAENYLGQDGAVTRYRVRGDPHLNGHSSVLVPGEVRGLSYALKNFGSGHFSWAELLQPAVAIAERGFDVYPYLAGGWNPDEPLAEGSLNRFGRLLSSDASARIYTKGGEALEPGDRLVLTDYGQTLRQLADTGPDDFYEGELADEIARDFAANGGFITKTDLASYRPVVREPARGRFHGLQVVSDSPPGSGALIIALLQAAERLDVGRLQWNTPAYIDELSRLFRLVFADRARFMGDPDFVSVPVDTLVSTEHADELVERIRTRQDLAEPGWQPVIPEGTAHLSVVDAEGNAVGITHTLGSTSGTSTPGLGFLYNNDMHVFDPTPGKPNSVMPGKQPVNGGGPTLLLDDAAIRLVIGSPAGARKITGVVQAILNVFAHGMSMAGAVTAPRFHAEDLKHVVILEPSIPAATSKGLEEMGYRIIRGPQGSRLSAIRVRESGELEGGADPRAGGGLASV